MRFHMAAGLLLSSVGMAMLSSVAATTAIAEVPSAEMTIHVDAPPGWAATSPFYIQVAAPSPAPSGTDELVSPSGANHGTVSFDSPCKGKLYYSGLGTGRWCIKVTGLGAGSDAATTIQTTALTLKLTVGIRHNFWWAPLVVIALSILISLFLLWWTTYTLPSIISSKLLKREVRQGDSDGVPTEKRIVGLNDWVTDQQEATSDQTLLGLVRPLVRYGPMHAGEARARLTIALRSSTLPDTHPVRVEAMSKSQRKDHHIEDFYTDGNKNDQHPADQMIAGLDRAEGLQAQIIRAKAVIGGLPPVDVGGLNRVVADAEHAFSVAGDEAGLTFAEACVADTWRKIHDRMAELVSGGPVPGPAPEARDTKEATVSDLGSRSGWSSLRPFVGGSRSRSLGDLWTAGFLTALTVVVLVVAAGITVASSSYFSNATFGTSADYWALAIAAFGSTAVAGVVAIVAFWRVQKT